MNITMINPNQCFWKVKSAFREMFNLNSIHLSPLYFLLNKNTKQ